MTPRSITLTTLALGALTLIAGAAIARQSAPAPAGNAPRAKPEAAPAQPDPAAKRRAAMKRLEPLIGEWTAVGTYGKANPDGSYDQQVGTWSVRWLYEGAHLEIRFDVVVNKEHRLYTGLFSYNPARERYETVWLGHAGYRFTETGVFDPFGKELVLTSFHDYPSPERQTKSVSTFVFNDANSIVVRDVATDPDTGKKDVTYYVDLKRKK